MALRHSIYAISDQSNPLMYRYIGQTTKPIEVRLAGHVRSARAGSNGHRDNWIRSVLFKGSRLVVELIALAESHVEADDLEKSFIAAYRAAGFDLTNVTDGGGGMSGYHLPKSAETRAKMRLAAIGRPKSAEHRARLAAAFTGRTIPMDVRAKISHSLKTNPRFKAACAASRTPEYTARMAAGMRSSEKAAAHRRRLADAKIGVARTDASRWKQSQAWFEKRQYCLRALEYRIDQHHQYAEMERLLARDLYVE